MSQLVDCTGTEIICGNCIALTGDGWDSPDQSEANVAWEGPIRGQGYRSSPPSDDVLWWTLPGNPWHQWPETRGSQPIRAQYPASGTNQEWARTKLSYLPSRMCAIQVSYYPLKLRENVCIKENVPPESNMWNLWKPRRFYWPSKYCYRFFSERSHAWWSLDCFPRHV